MVERADVGNASRAPRSIKDVTKKFPEEACHAAASADAPAALSVLPFLDRASHDLTEGTSRQIALSVNGLRL
jgi:hypothetical protein